MKSLIGSFLRDEQGQDLIEYAILMVCLAIAVLGFAAVAHAK